MKEKYYNFSMSLSTPYVWGEGYGKATLEEINNNKKAMNEIFNFLKSLDDGFKIVPKREEYSCDSWFNKTNGIEEIYVHPMELSGVLDCKKIEALKNFILNASFPNTKLENVRLEGEVKKYSFTEVLDVINSKLEEVLPVLKEKYYGNLPMNYDFKEFGLKLKTYLFVSCSFNSKQETMTGFLTQYLNEKIRESK